MNTPLKNQFMIQWSFSFHRGSFQIEETFRCSNLLRVNFFSSICLDVWECGLWTNSIDQKIEVNELELTSDIQRLEISLPNDSIWSTIEINHLKGLFI
jgi:hypothetical protein